MASFSDIQTQLAVMVGAQSAEELPPAEQAQIKQVINQMYRHCYLPVDGSRPQWSTREANLVFAAPKGASLTLTAGSNTFTSDTYINPDNAGSLVLLPNKQRSRLDEVASDGLSGTLTTTATASGAAGVTVYGNVAALPTDTADVEKHPSMGERILTPLDDREQERVHHTLTEDFGMHQIKTGVMEVAEPHHYYVDETMVGGVVRPRLAVYPLPDVSYTVSVRINISPAALVDDADEPLLPLDVVDDILVPMARAKFAEITPRYNSQNIQFLVADRKDAEKRLKHLAQKQKGRTRRILLRTGY